VYGDKVDIKFHTIPLPALLSVPPTEDVK